MAEQNPQYRLIWFQHLHKAAGSSIVNQAIANGEILYPNHEKGNPCSSKGELLPLWDYGSEMLSDFIDSCERDGVTFVATEWGTPDFQSLSKDPRVFLITCLRDPWNRLVSNYNYDFYFGHTRKKGLIEYFSGEHRMAMDNHIVRVYSRMCDASKSEFDNAAIISSIENLNLFDLVLVIERPGDLDTVLFDSLDWEKYDVHKHQTFGNRWALIGLIRSFRLIAAVQYIMKIKRKVGDEDRAFFERESALENSLYQTVLEDEIRGRVIDSN